MVKKVDEDDSDEALRGLLAFVEPREPSPEVSRAVAEIPLRHPRRAGFLLFWPGAERWVAACAAAGLAGALLGVWTSSFEDDDEWDALSTMALGADLSEELAP